tara:strand:- start:40 stop:174 length:135 start_codon:yes stop_codon:yes gene_type:complete
MAKGSGKKKKFCKIVFVLCCFVLLLLIKHRKPAKVPVKNKKKAE